MKDDLLLSLLWVVPLGGAGVVLLIPDRAAVAIKRFALGTTLVTLLLALVAWESFRAGGQVRPSLTLRAAANGIGWEAFVFTSLDGHPPWSDLVVRHEWIPEFGMEYFLGLDGISLALILLTSFISVLACLASWEVTTKVKGYFSLYLVLVSSLMGVFLALDLVLFYVFFEVMLLPMYFLIALWGGERREYAALKFLLYTLFGSVFILVAILALYFWPGDGAPVARWGADPFRAHTFDMMALADGAATTGYYGPWIQGWIFLLFFVGFAVKLPSFPFHTWLPDAHVEAPTPISMILAGVLLKVGGYGLIRLAWPLAPVGAAAWAYPVAALGVFGILYGALAALAQTDFKRLVAYSSVSHMGYVTLGMAALALNSDPRYYAFGLNGAVLMMLAHGVTSTGLFFVVGMVYERTGTRDLRALGGLGRPLPGLFAVALILFFGALGLPGLCGFVPEVFVTLAAFHFSPVLGALAASAVILTAGYMLWAFRRVFQGPRPDQDQAAALPDLTPREWAISIPLVVLTVVLGIVPRVVLDWTSPSVDAVAREIVEARGNRTARAELTPDAVGRRDAVATAQNSTHP